MQQSDSPKSRRERVAPGIYLKNGAYIAGFNDPNTGKWTMPTLEAASLRDAKRERASLLSALREGRAASKSTLSFDTCLDRYLEALESGTTREKTVRHNRWIAKRYLRDRLGAKSVQEITTNDVRKVLRSVRHLSGWTQTKVVQVMREASRSRFVRTRSSAHRSRNSTRGSCRGQARRRSRDGSTRPS